MYCTSSCGAEPPSLLSWLPMHCAQHSPSPMTAHLVSSFAAVSSVEGKARLQHRSRLDPRACAAEGHDTSCHDAMSMCRLGSLPGQHLAIVWHL